jgi:F-type H+-transporting ATPase subunit b
MSARVLAQEEGGDLFLIPNGTFVVELVIFLFVLFVIWRYIVPPIKKATQDRQEMVRQQIEESRQTKQRLEQADAAYREALSEARTEAAKIRDRARAEAAQIKTELREQAEREVALIRQRGEEQLERQREQVKRELSAEIGRLAVTLAGRIVGESMEDEARRRGTVDRFIAELEGMAAPESRPAEQARADVPEARAEPAPAGPQAPGRRGGRGGSGGRSSTPRKS